MSREEMKNRDHWTGSSGVNVELGQLAEDVYVLVVLTGNKTDLSGRKNKDRI